MIGDWVKSKSQLLLDQEASWIDLAQEIFKL